MTITVKQVLHGYQNGHQLLASSKDLSFEEKKTLLLQSDLSGSSIEEGFKTYITGYPIKSSNIYAFARSWYADEMDRPGCVWTQTLLINFSDLGKIPELNLLFQYFTRPVINKYDFYTNDIIIEEDLLKSSFHNSIKKNSQEKNQILAGLYQYATKTIVIPSFQSEKYESAIMDLWSDQWPRLRREFSFCSGALSLRIINEKEFDLLIVPTSKMNLILRQSENIITLKEIDFLAEQETLAILEKFPQIKIRQFLWIYGADIQGKRKNYFPLLRIFEQLNNKNISLSQISNQINKYFPSPSEAKNFKNKLFGNDSILNPKFSEKDILEFLITANDIDFIDSSEISIEARLKNLIDSKEINFYDFIDVWKNAAPQRLSDDVWKHVDFSNSDISKLIEENEWLINLIVDKYIEFFYSVNTWQLNDKIQEKLLYAIIDSKNNINWSNIVNAMLEANSGTILKLIKYRPKHTSFLSLDWLNKSDNPKSLPSDLAKIIMSVYSSFFLEWLEFHKKQEIDVKIFELIFNHFYFEKILKINLSAEKWIKAYNDLKINDHNLSLTSISCFMLTLGFENKINSCEYIVRECFHDVFSDAAGSKLDIKHWNLIPKITQIEEFDDSAFFIKLFGFLPSKRKTQVDDWDYCEILIRTLVNKYIQLNWNREIFLQTLKNSHSFKRAIEYCFSFKKGTRFIEKIITEVNNKTIKSLNFQQELLSRYEI